MKGFTLLEILIVISIMVILLTVVVVSFSSLTKNQALENAVEEIISQLNSARSKTLGSENLYQYGVHFESGEITLFRGTVYSQTDPNNAKITLSPQVEISDISLNGGVNAVFQKQTGKTDNFGTIIIRLKADVSKTKTIEIEKTGIINVL